MPHRSDLLFGPYEKAILFALGTPNLCWEVIKRLVVASSTGISPPAGSLSAAHIVCDGFALENAITLGL